MQNGVLDILMVEDNAAQALLLREALKGSGIALRLEHVRDLSGALRHVNSAPVELVLLDLGLPDSSGIETVQRMHHAAPELPIVVLTALSDEETAVQAVREGAQDYLDKAQLTGRMLGRVIRYAVERARSEREIRQANERFRLAASAAHEIIYDWDLREGTVFRSEGMTRVLGVSPGDANGTRDWWIGRVHPDDVETLHRVTKSAFEKETTFFAEYRVRHEDGHYVHLWDRAQVMRDAQGTPIRVVGGALDVTERVRAQEEIRRTKDMLEAFIKSSPLAIITLDRDGRVMTWNPAAEEMFGWKEHEVLSRELPIIPENARREYRRMLDRDFQGASRRGTEAKRLHRDGTVLDVSISTASIRDATGQVVAVMGILEDITQRKRSEEERTRMQEQLHETQKLEAVGQLAAGVAHDFNNLLTVILGNVDRMNRMLSEHDESRSILTMIEQAARQATGVTRSLLTFSNKVPSVKLQTNLSESVEESVRLLRRLLPASITTQVEVPDEPIWVLADPSQIQRVLLNLGINARDAMPDGGTLRVTLSRIPAAEAGLASNPSGECVQMVVSDTGTGIPPEILPQIFDPFFTTKPRGQGTGLGLAIVRSIVQDHDGQIEVDAEAGVGSSFIVTLPVLAAEMPVHTGPAEVPRGQGELILLVEDHAYVREVMASALRSFGYQVVEASDGTSALELHEKRGPEFAALVFDHDLPGRTGLQCIREIRQRGDRRPAIVTSGSLSLDSEHVLQENTFLLQKPFQMKELARVISNVLQQ